MVGRALSAYGIGLIGLILIKILAPGFYAKQDIKTPVKIAIGVLIMTQVSNYIFVPIFSHAGLTLSIGLGALANALLLFLGLRKRGIYQPSRGLAALFRAVDRRVSRARGRDALGGDQFRLDRHARGAARTNRAARCEPRSVRRAIFRYAVRDGLQIRVFQKANALMTTTRILDYFSYARGGRREPSAHRSGFVARAGRLSRSRPARRARRDRRTRRARAPPHARRRRHQAEGRRAQSLSSFASSVSPAISTTITIPTTAI